MTAAPGEEVSAHIRIPLRLVDGAIPNLPVQDEIRPTDDAAVIRLTDDCPELTRMRWGLIPFHHRGPLKAFKLATFNTRAGTVATSPTFGGAFRRRRALIVADGWVEWKGEGKPKPKFYIERADATPIAFAGLWERCRPSDSEPLESYTMATQPPGALSDVHDRAPVVLTPDQWLSWLDPTGDANDLLAAEPADRLKIRAFADAQAEWAGESRQVPLAAREIIPRTK